MQIRTKLKHPSKITLQDITLFIRQLATLLAAGVPLNESLATLVISQQKIKLRLLILTLKAEISAGKNLSDAMQKHPLYFNSLTTSLIRLGEHTGHLDTLLLSLAHHHEKKQALVKKVQQAFFYPTIISLCALIMLTMMLVFVIPRFAELFADMQGKLPLFTRCIFKLSTLFRQCSLPFLILTMLILLVLRLSGHTHRIKQAMLVLLTRAPIIQSCRHHLTLTHFAHHLALCYKSGLSLLDALRLLLHQKSDSRYASVIFQLRNKINAGVALHTAMSAHAYFPPLMIQMVKTGEETGKLDQMLDKLADFYAAETDQTITRLGQLLEPLIMIILGVLIGGLVTGMYLPIFNLGSAV